ncbi:MAG: UxaA family hydrolase [Beijerinckiaceae bacterium]
MGLDARLILLDASDNVAVVCSRIGAGATFNLPEGACTAAVALAIGHKVAVRPIAAGEKILKYGAPIGSALCGIARGEHVHVHNVRSDYTPTHHLLDAPAADR